MQQKQQMQQEQIQAQAQEKQAEREFETQENEKNIQKIIIEWVSLLLYDTYPLEKTRWGVEFR